eukprot:192113-Karenia_brevis.AAC.1
MKSRSGFRKLNWKTGSSVVGANSSVGWVISFAGLMADGHTSCFSGSPSTARAKGAQEEAANKHDLINAGTM